MTTDTIIELTRENERLKLALRGCLSLSRQTSPYLYSAALAGVQQEAHQALYGDSVPVEQVDRPIATYMRNFDAELTQEEAE